MIISLALILTIGGVYATWTYTGTNDIADAYGEIKVTIEDAEYVGAAGTYKITSNLVLTIDQRDENHYAKLVFASNNANPINLTVTFTPNANADDTIKTKGVKSELYWTTSSVMQYTTDKYGNYVDVSALTENQLNPEHEDYVEVFHRDIFELTHPSNGSLDNEIIWTEVKDTQGKITHFEYVLNEEDLMGLIKLSTFTVEGGVEGGDTFRLDTKAEHDAFRTALTGNIVARVTDGIVN